MRHILFDPILLTVPDNHTTQQQKATYLKSLNLWREVYLTTSKNDADWHVSKEIMQVLKEHQLFPDIRKLRRLLTAANADAQGQGHSYSPHADVNVDHIDRWLIRFCEEAHSIDGIFATTSEPAEEKLEVQGYYLPDMKRESITSTPLDFSRWPASIQQKTRELLGYIVICAHVEHSYAADLNIATLPFLNPASSVKLVSISVRIEYISDPEGQKDPSEETISHTFPLLLSSADLPFAVDEWQWDGAEESLRAAINREYDARYRILIEELQRSRQEKQRGGKAAKLNNTVQRQYPISYTFGSHFLKILQEAAKDVARENLPKRFIQTAASIIADHPHSPVKPFRKSKGGDVEQRRRSNDKAWRVYVTVNHGGWRLNYWQGPDKNGQERIEFSIIQKHEDPEKIYYD